MRYANFVKIIIMIVGFVLSGILLAASNEYDNDISITLVQSGKTDKSSSDHQKISVIQKYQKEQQLKRAQRIRELQKMNEINTINKKTKFYPHDSAAVL